jgi:hypothetical protein
VVPFLLADANRVREAILEFKHSSRIWYEALWWGDSSRWSEPGERHAFGSGNLPRHILDALKAKGIEPGGDNLLGKSWLDLAADPALMASTVKCIAWQLDTIFEYCGKDALYGVTLSEEEPEVCLEFGGQPAGTREYFGAHRDEVQAAMTRGFNQIYDALKARYPWLKIAPGAYPQWVQPSLKRDAVVMDLYPNPGHEEEAIRKWVEAWGTDTEHYILLWGYGDLDRRLECDRFDRVTNGLVERGFRNLGFFHPKLALEDRAYCLFARQATGTYAPYDLTRHAAAVRALTAETEAAAAKLGPLLGDRLPGRPPGLGEGSEGLSREGLVAAADAWYAFREGQLDEAYAAIRRLEAYLHLGAIAGILQAEGFLPESAGPKANLAPAALLRLERLSKEFPTLPDLYAELLPLEHSLQAAAVAMADAAGVPAGAEFAADLRERLDAHLAKAVAGLRSADCQAAFAATTALYDELRTAGADRSWRLRIVFGNRYGYPLNLRVEVAVDYGDGSLVPVRSDTPFESSEDQTEEWLAYLPRKPVALRFDTSPWSGTLDVKAIELSQSRQTLTPTAVAELDHVTDIADWLAGKTAAFSLSPWGSRATVRIAY